MLKQTFMDGDMNYLRLFVARHGETDWNAQARAQGMSDISLNEKGKEQAAKLVERYSFYDFDGIYCSNLARAKESVVGLKGKSPMSYLPELNEQSLGSFEGKHMDADEGRMRQEFVRRVTDPNDSLDGGESREEHRKRVARGLERILDEHETGHIFVMGHGGTNTLILAELFSWDTLNAAQFFQRNCEVFMFDIFPNGYINFWQELLIE